MSGNEELDRLYSIVLHINNELLEKSNEPSYASATFDDAVDFTITCNALSLIKSYFQENHYSVTCALNMRNIIECYSVKLMEKAGDISEEKKKLFLEQYKLIDYDSYTSDGELKYKNIANFKELKLRYEDAKQKFLQVVKTEQKLKKIIRTRLPFLCEEKADFNDLIEKYCPRYLPDYIYLSIMIHPRSYLAPVDAKVHGLAFNNVMNIVYKCYGHLPKPQERTYTEDDEYIYGFKNPVLGNLRRTLFELQKQQWTILKNIAKSLRSAYGRDYLTNFIDEFAMAIHDVNTDSQMGFPENAKMKFKVVAEMLACFDKIYFDFSKKNKDGYYYEMMKFHDYLKDGEFMQRIATEDLLPEQFQPLTEEQREEVYALFKDNFPESEMNKKQFFKAFDKPLGFFTDGDGKVPNYGELVKEYFDKLGGESLVKNSEITEADFYSMMYKESHNLSHGCCYLFFSNIGAFLDDNAVIQFLDESILGILAQLKLVFLLCGRKDKKLKPTLKLILEANKTMPEIVQKKHAILQIKKEERE